MLVKAAGSSVVFRRKASKESAQLALVAVKNFSGGGPKKPPMPATETNFDVVFVGNQYLYLF